MENTFGIFYNSGPKLFGAKEPKGAQGRNRKSKVLPEKMETLGHNHKRTNGIDIKLVMQTCDGNEIIGMDEIIYLEADEGYTSCFLSTNGSVLLSKSLSLLEDNLCRSHFVRIHRKYIVNVHYIKRYKHGRGGHVVLKNKKKLKISDSRKGENWSVSQAFYGGGNDNQWTGGIRFDDGTSSVTVQNDFFSFRGEDRNRTNAVEIGYKDFVIGTTLYTNDPDGDGSGVDNGTNKREKTNKHGKGAWIDVWVQDITQNFAHRMFGYPFFNTDYGPPSSAFVQGGGFFPYSLYLF